MSLSTNNSAVRLCLHNNNGHQCTNPGPWCAEHYSERCSGKDFCKTCSHYVVPEIKHSEHFHDEPEETGYDSNEDLYEPESDHENDPYIESDDEQEQDYPTEEEYLYWVYNDALSNDGEEVNANYVEDEEYPYY